MSKQVYAKVISQVAVSSGLVKVGISLTKPVANSDDLFNVVATSLPKGIVPVVGSFLQSASANNIMVGYVTAKAERITMDEASERNLVTASENVLLDQGTKELWDIDTVEGTVVKRDTDDMSQLLLAVQSASPYSQCAKASTVAPSMQLASSSFMVASFVTGDGEVKNASIAMVDQKASFCVGSDGESYSVPHDVMLGTTAVHMDDLFSAVAARRETEVASQVAEFEVNFPDSPGDVDSALDYYTRLYSWAPELNGIAEEIIRESVVL